MKTHSAHPHENALLKRLRQKPKTSHSGALLARTLGITQNAVAAHVQNLRKNGYRITCAPAGYRFHSAPDRLIAEEITWNLKTRFIGRSVFCHDSLDSTNRLALELAKQGCPEGAVVTAEYQTRGRGRMGRTWISPKAKNICLSVLLKPQIELRETPKLTLTAAIAAAEMIEEQTRLQPLIRWPNDILINGQKIAGILTEMNTEKGGILTLVIGIGINVHASKTELPPEAVSLRMLSRKDWSRPALAASFLNHLEERYLDLMQGRFHSLVSSWESRSFLRGRSVKALLGSRSVTGTALGIDEEDGGLWIRKTNGIPSKIHSGDLTCIR